MTEDEILQIIESDMRRQRERVRAMILQNGGKDALADFDRQMRDLDLGVTGARAKWHSLSDKQRRTMQALRVGAALVRIPNTTGYCVNSIGHLGKVCSLPTARALSRHELIAPDGGAFDPESRFVLTERGRFVFAHGRETQP